MKASESPAEINIKIRQIDKTTERVITEKDCMISVMGVFLNQHCSANISTKAAVTICVHKFHLMIDSPVPPFNIPVNTI
jgi:hypothetical protein